MSHVVQWEHPDYTFIPHGLMAEYWGKTGLRTEITDAIRDGRLRFRRMMDNDKARDSIEYIWSLDDETVLAGAHYGSDIGAEIGARLANGEDRWINPSWVSGMCAQDAYERGLIDGNEFDRLAAD